MQLIICHSVRFLFIFLISYSCFGQITKQETELPVKFEVSSIRTLSNEEQSRKTGDNIIISGFSLKCRVSNQGKQTVYLYTDFANSIVPRGYGVKETKDGVVWIIDASGKISNMSPGLKPLSSGAWLMLTEGDAVEWESIQETTSIEENRAMTVFMKFGGSEKITELFSNFYKVPLRE